MLLDSSITSKIKNDYWVSKLSSHSTRASIGDRTTQVHQISVPRELLAGLSKVSGENSKAEFVSYLGIFHFLLSRYFNLEQTLISSPSFEPDLPFSRLLFFDL